MSKHVLVTHIVLLEYVFDHFRLLKDTPIHHLKPIQVPQCPPNTSTHFGDMWGMIRVSIMIFMSLPGYKSIHWGIAGNLVLEDLIAYRCTDEAN